MKKVLAVSAIAALGFSGLVNAGGLPEEMPMAPMAYSSDQGVYIGLEGGWGLTNWKHWDAKIDAAGMKVFDIGNSRDNGFVGRVFAGYDLCKYFGLEVGYTYFFNKPEITANVSGTDLDNQKISRTHAVDLMGKIKAPVTDEFNLYAKLGAVYLMSKLETETDEEEDKLLPGLYGDTSRHNINIAFGAGVDYFITPNVIANAEWLRFHGNADMLTDKYQPYTDAFMVGLRYKFDI